MTTTALPAAAPDRDALSQPLPRALARLLSLADFEAAARRRLPRPIFGYVAGAAEDNQSLQDNRRAFSEYA
ncbi:MAG TPA: alpha-hydroxy-acid oxidizing protein, partial [Achromobacter sp.]